MQPFFRKINIMQKFSKFEEIICKDPKIWTNLAKMAITVDMIYLL